MTTTPATVSLDEVIADYLVAREAGDHLTPGTFAGRMPPALRATFLAEIASIEAIEQLATPAQARREVQAAGFRLVRRIGHGASGVVYEAEQSGRGRRVAIKMLHGAASGDPQARLRFGREARILARLDHPAIVALHDATTIEGHQALVMQLAPGRSLRAVLQAREDTTHPDHAIARLWLADPRKVAATFAIVAEALAHAHARGVVHRDLKPANLAIDAFGQPLLLDFGLATSSGEGDDLTRCGDVLGTPLYMAPEQLAGREAGAATDVWALGSVLQECLTGQPAAGPQPGSLRHVPAALRRVLRACRRTEPARRPNAAWVARRLRGIGAADGPCLRHWLCAAALALCGGRSWGEKITAAAVRAPLCATDTVPRPRPLAAAEAVASADSPAR